MNCRFCNSILQHEFIDLLNAPPSNSFLTERQLNDPEVFYPLKLFVCEKCWLVQIDEHKKAGEIFNENYVYFSSYSKTWLLHARKYSEQVIGRFGLDEHSLVVEVASNDGYLLQFFKEKNIPVLGVEPTLSTATAAESKGIKTITEFFGTALAKELSGRQKADLLIGNNVLAHVPDLNDFVRGLKLLLNDRGVITMEFPHLVSLISDNQFDTIYHEHFSYFSFYAVNTIFKAHGLTIFDAELLPTHGGSLRIFATHSENTEQKCGPGVKNIMEQETEAGVTALSYYKGFPELVTKIKLDLLDFLVAQKKNGRLVAGYGAAAKGNTLLNYCGIKGDLVSFVVDISPHKQGKFLPGSHIPVVAESQIKACRPDYILILPWNIKKEIIEQLSYIKAWGGKFVIPLPNLHIIPAI